MIREIEIEGFKSIDRLRLKPGRVTVLIGANGCGKSNILEAIAMAGSAASDRQEHEFLASRGIRVSDPRLMRPAFSTRAAESHQIRISIDGHAMESFDLLVKSESSVYEWPAFDDSMTLADLVDAVRKLPKVEQKRIVETFVGALNRQGIEHSSSLAMTFQETSALIEAIDSVLRRKPLRDFLIYAPENTALRTFQQESQILPLGIRGEGLFAHLKQLRAKHPDILAAISDRLGLIDWFGGFDVPGDLAPYEQRLDIRDRYIDPLTRLDQRSANEGFLFLLFYYTLLISPQTPRFFAVDNVDASLNPRLCARLMRDIVELARAHDRQVIVTTHNPALLDGLDLTDPEQKLYVVFRDPDGPTRVERIKPPRPIEGAPEIRLSEAFIRGHLGGLPTNF